MSTSKTQALIESLKAEGRVDSIGTITIDREKARDKLQRFLHTEPTYYILELVQAAHAQGATEIAFDIDVDDMRMAFDGEPFTVTDFDQLYNALLGEGVGEHPQARRLLALGLNTANSMRPRRVDVESGRGPQGEGVGARTRLDASRPPRWRESSLLLCAVGIEHGEELLRGGRDGGDTTA